MSTTVELRCDIYKDLGGEVLVSLYECSAEGQWSLIDSERFGPFDTGADMCMWITRHASPRLRLPLR